MSTDQARSTVLDRLSEITQGSARAGTDDDAVLGVVPGVCVSPADTGQVSAVMTLAAQECLAVVPRGSGTKLSWGDAPARFDVLLDLGRLNGVIEHASGDLIAVVGAGTPLATVRDELAAGGQRLAADPPRGGTLGGAVATGDFGPLRQLGGPIRDLVLGCTYVRADGAVAKAGGRVVKNVAGYDLSRVFASSFGTLAVLTELTLRLHPVPQDARWIETTTTDRDRFCALVREFVHTQLAPSGVELTAEFGSDAPTYRIGVHLEGTGPGVAARTDLALGVLGPDAVVHEQAPQWWGAGVSGTATVKVTHELAFTGAVLAGIESALPAGARATWRACGAVGVGEVALHLEPDAPATALAGFVTALRAAAVEFGGSCVLRDAPPDLRAGLDPWGEVGDALPLMRALKDRLDPNHLLSPGRFVGGI